MTALLCHFDGGYLLLARFNPITLAPREATNNAFVFELQALVAVQSLPAASVRTNRIPSYASPCRSHPLTAAHNAPPVHHPCQPTLGTTPAAAARAALALGDSPARLNALQSALRSARPGLADPIMTALGSVPQLSNPDDLQLISSLVLGLEEVATQLGVPHNSSGSCGGEGAMVADRGGSLGSSVSGVPALEAALSGAVDVTLQQAAGSLAEQQAQSAAGAWRALRELCWCGEPAARAAASSWLQRLLGVSLEQGGEVGLNVVRIAPDDAWTTHGMAEERLSCAGCSGRHKLCCMQHDHSTPPGEPF